MPETIDESLEATSPESEVLDQLATAAADEPTPDEPADLLARWGGAPVWKKVTAAAAFALAVIVLSMVIASLRDGDTSTLAAAGPLPTTTPVAEEIPPNTLGIRFDDVRELWNSIEQPPSITRALRRTPEPGALDSFLYRFAHADLIGAYEENSDYVTALMVRSSLTDPDVGTFYLHLCQIVDPFSPQCIDNYFTIGLAGLSLEEFAATGQESSWTHEGIQWRVSVVDGDLTIRALAAATD